MPSSGSIGHSSSLVPHAISEFEFGKDQTHLALGKEARQPIFGGHQHSLHSLQQVLTYSPPWALQSSNFRLSRVHLLHLLLLFGYDSASCCLQHHIPQNCECSSALANAVCKSLVIMLFLPWYNQEISTAQDIAASTHAAGTAIAAAFTSPVISGYRLILLTSLSS